ncbi:hypothetical protein Tco_0212647 [Tanacetum coccineum]
MLYLVTCPSLFRCIPPHPNHHQRLNLPSLSTTTTDEEEKKRDGSDFDDLDDPGGKEWSFVQEKDAENTKAVNTGWIDVDYELAARMIQEEQEKYTIEERAMLLAEFFKRRKKQLSLKDQFNQRKNTYQTTKSPKKPKVMKSAKDVTEEEVAEYEKEKEELRLSLKIISKDDMKADGSLSYHRDTQAFLRRLDRQDLNDLYRVDAAAKD